MKIKLETTKTGWSFHTGFHELYIDQVGLNRYSVGHIENNKKIEHLQENMFFDKAKKCLEKILYDFSGGSSMLYGPDDFEEIKPV